jgi:hypothetical protein
MMTDWKRAIGTLILTKQAFANVDKQKLWPHRLPAVAATPESITRAETVLGHRIDPRYREFLHYADGWPNVFQGADLFGTADLVGGPRMDQANEILNLLDKEGVLTRSGVNRAQVLPVAYSVPDGDTFVIVKGSGIVIWFAGGEIDRFASFDEFFLAMIDYHRLMIRNAQQRNERST